MNIKVLFISLLGVFFVTSSTGALHAAAYTYDVIDAEVYKGKVSIEGMSDVQTIKVNLESGTVIPQIYKRIKLPFTQVLDSTDEAMYANDLVIKQLGLTNTPTLIPMVEYTTRVEGNKIAVTFLVDYSDVYSVQVKDPHFIRYNGDLTSPSEVYITTSNTPVTIESPKVSLESGTIIPQLNKEVEIPFTQPLDSSDEAFYANDIVIKKLGLTNIPTLIPMIDYTTRVEGNKIVVTFLVDYSDVYSVQVKDPYFIRFNGNLASTSEVYITTSNTPVTIESPKVSLESGTIIPQLNKEIEIPFTQSLDSSDEALYAHDLAIKKLGLTNIPTLIPMVEYTTRVEGNKIIVTFLVNYSDVYSVQVKDPHFIRSNGTLASPSEVYITTSNTPVTIESPKVSLESGTIIPQLNKEVEIPFTQPLDSTDEALYAHDLVIKQLGLTNIPTLIPMVEYTTRVEGNKIIVTFLVNYSDVYSVQVKDPHFIRSNGTLASPSEVYITTSNTPVTIESPKVSLESGTIIPQLNKEIEIPFTQPLDSTDEALYANDLVIKQLGLTNIPTLIPMVDYTTRVEGNKIIVNFLVDYTDEYAVQVRDALFIRSNGIPAMQSEFYTTTKNDQLIVD